jgi:tetratricopeptide (TPR) repeat protein
MTDRAIEDYTAALRLDPKDAAAYNNRGIAYAMKEDYRRARADWEKALEIDPNDGNALYIRGELYELKNMGY